MAVSEVRLTVGFCDHGPKHAPINLTPISMHSVIHSPFEGFGVGYETSIHKPQTLIYKTCEPDKNQSTYKLNGLTTDNVCGCPEFKLERELYGFKEVSNGIDALRYVYGGLVESDSFLKRNIFLASRAIDREVAMRRYIPIFYKYKDVIKVGQIYHQTVDLVKFLPFTAFGTELNDKHIRYFFIGDGLSIYITQEYTNPIFDVLVDISIDTTHKNFYKAIKYEGRMSLIELVRLITNNKTNHQYLKNWQF